MKSNISRSRKVGQAVALLLPLLAPSLHAEDYWFKVEGADCSIWSDEPLQEGEKIRWSGSCKEGLVSGEGVIEVTLSGQSKLYFEGTMTAGKANGEGVLQSRSEQGVDRYAGGFANSLLHGHGVLVTAGGSRYEGDFMADKPHGYGLYQGADGSLYQGGLEAGLPQGEGFEYSADGSRYHGGFFAGERHGSGALLFADGSIYEGSFAADKASGEGVYIDQNRDIFIGSWLEGKADGKFVVNRADGSVERQTWRGDQLISSTGEKK
ncbi:MAG: MORN repeat-containing protein [Rhodothermales bacterium]